MRKIRKFQQAGNLNFQYKWEIPDVTKEAPELSWYTSNLLGSTPYKATISDIKASNLIKNTPHLRSNGDSNETQSSSNNSSQNKTFNLGTAGNQVAARGLNWATDYLSGKLTSSLLDDDSYVGQNVGNLVHNTLSSSTNTIANNILNGELITKNLGTNTLSSIAGGIAGLAGYGIGQGINALGGDSQLSRGIGAGVGKGISMIGGSALSNVLKGEKAFSGITDSVKAIKAFNAAKKAGTIKKGTDAFKDLQSLSTAGKWNLVGMGGQIVGTGLQAAFGPSHEYNGKYGNITRTMDSIYDMGSTIAGQLGPVGMGVSGLMALNKGLSNVFGSTDGMTRTDAILGSAFMPAPVKWLNMWGAKTTDTFNNQSWQNTQKTNAFMGNAFGNLGEKFDKATEEAGKTYGTFSRGSYNRAQDNIDFANTAWDKILAMADQNELQKIRSQYMTSINNQRYAQNIQGGWSPLARGKYGMKILNNATNHNIGMRLLSGAALIDNKQMILCNVPD